MSKIDNSNIIIINKENIISNQEEKNKNKFKMMSGLLATIIELVKFNKEDNDKVDYIIHCLGMMLASSYTVSNMIKYFSNLKEEDEIKRRIELLNEEEDLNEFDMDILEEEEDITLNKQ